MPYMFTVFSSGILFSIVEKFLHRFSCWNSDKIQFFQNNVDTNVLYNFI